MSSDLSLHPETAMPEDSIWVSIRETAKEQVQREPMLASFLHSIILKHDCLEDAVSFQLAERLPSSTLSEMPLREIDSGGHQGGERAGSSSLLLFGSAPLYEGPACAHGLSSCPLALEGGSLVFSTPLTEPYF